MSNGKMFKIDFMSSSNGQRWDECGLREIVAIFISHDSFGITSLRFLYVKDKIHRMSEQHGVLKGNFKQIKLDYPKEFLTALQGSYRSSMFTGEEIRSLTFVTNNATYGPFGKDEIDNDSVYSFDLALGSEEGWFNGFHGTVHDDRIKSIGIYITPTTAYPDDNPAGQKSATSTSLT